MGRRHSKAIARQSEKERRPEKGQLSGREAVTNVTEKSSKTGGT